jgi:hypothetical protein
LGPQFAALFLFILYAITNNKYEWLIQNLNTFTATKIITTMKKILLLICIATSGLANAQVKLNKGQKINVTSTITQEIEVMGMTVTNNTNSSSLIEVKEASDKNYVAVYKLSKLSVKAEAMGQEQSYDSEKPEDKDSELGKSFSDKIGVEVKVNIDKKTGKAVAEKADSPEKKADDAEDPMAGMMEMFGAKDNESAATQSAIFLIPSGIKVGDSWSDSTDSNEKIKSVTTYTLKSITGNEATVSLFSKKEGAQDVEAQGMQMTINISAKTEGEILVDTKTSLTKKTTRVADITGNMDMMGQSTPLSSKMTEITEYK